VPDWASLATLQPGVNAIEAMVAFETGAVLVSMDRWQAGAA
jgi:hypothetical protein